MPNALQKEESVRAMMATSTNSPRFWRIFPWDAGARPGAQYSPEFIPPGQGSGRFDLEDSPPVLDLAESPAHAIAEKFQQYRGREIGWPELRESGHPLSLVEVSMHLPESARIVDLCDPAALTRYGCRPDELMSRDFTRTQAVSRRLHESGLCGFRVWSALTGDWHSTFLFVDRLRPDRDLSFATPVAIDFDMPPFREAAELLGLRVAGK
jgi:RES domain-containing protein